MDHQITYRDRDNASEIIDLELAKKNAKIDYEDEDDLLQLFIDAVSDEIERFTGRTFIKREVIIGLSAFPKKYTLPVSANAAIESIEYVDFLGNTETLDPDYYKLFSYDNGYRQRILFTIPVMPAINVDEDFPIQIKLSVGFTAEDMPADIKRAALLMFNNAEAFRENMPVHLNRSAQAILRPHKRY